MKIFAQTIWLRSYGLTAIFALAVSTLALHAQTTPAYAPPTAPTAQPSSSALASMNEDIQSLIRQVGQLQLQVAQLQQDNNNLRQQLITKTDVNTAVENASSKSRDETNKAITQAVTQANNDLRKEIVGTVTKQIEALARDTNTQLQTLAQAIHQPPPVSTRVTASDPGKQPPTQEFGDGDTYIVKPGDSLSKIAAHYAQHKVTLGDIEKANNLTPADANKLREGQNLFIPFRDTASAPPAATK